jgi:glycosyltransferase involved in cell wall biosynthesis
VNITACLITFNEKDNLRRCLSSIRPVVDEIIVVDSGSTDGSQEICRSYGAIVTQHPWEGYVVQKNLALSLATNPWVLSIDADEELSPALASAIQMVRQNPPSEDISGYTFSRVVWYRGEWIWHGNWFPDVLVRLFQKERARFAGGSVHERLEIEGAVRALPGYLHHYTFTTEEDRQQRIRKYAKLWAANAAQRGKRALPWSAAVHAGWRFIRGYVVRRGFLDGTLGLEIARNNAEEVYLKYQALREMNHA